MSDYGFKPAGLINFVNKEQLVFPQNSLGQFSINDLPLPDTKKIDWDLDSTPTLHLCGRIGQWVPEENISSPAVRTR